MNWDNHKIHAAHWQIAKGHHCSSLEAAACQTTYARLTLSNRQPFFGLADSYGTTFR